MYISMYLKLEFFDRHGLESKRLRNHFLKEVSIFNPDIIHLHNIHGYYINIPLLFEYFKENPDIKIIWTLHDCWSFTGHCAYFTYIVDVKNGRYNVKIVYLKRISK